MTRRETCETLMCWVRWGIVSLVCGCVDCVRSNHQISPLPPGVKQIAQWHCHLRFGCTQGV